MRIKSLSSAVANQIAAGEVIENPASVVKELLENALDAGATAITIDIGFGGLNQIKISDNGTGIVAEDLPLAIAPHATSKLTQLADLSTLTSMGFRGEALASIASISRITISSKPAQQDHAMMLHMDGEVVELSPCARSQGTTIDVRDLFYNAPVRRRFLKSERSEYLAIEHVVKRFALSAPEINLILKHNAKLMLELPAATHEQSLRVRIQRLLGKAFMDQAIHLDVERAGMHLTGWISGPAYQRSQNDKQWIYLNQRMVKDKLIQHAFKQAYENRLYPGRHPACLLYLSIPTADVDVNVHPTKHEVRFQQPRLVHDFIGSQIAQVLMSAPDEEERFDRAELVALQANNPEDMTTSPWIASPAFAAEPTLRHCDLPSTYGINSHNDLAGRRCERSVAIQSSELDTLDCRASLATTEPGRFYTNGGVEDPHSPMRLKENYIPRPQAIETRVSTQNRTSWTILNQQFGLLIWSGQSYLFHIQQAQEQRCLWSIQQNVLPLASRPLLVPVSIEHNIQNSEPLKASFDACRTYGIHIEMNDTRVIVRTLPVSMPQLAIKPLLAHVLEQCPAEADMPRVLSRCQPTDAFQLDVYEKDALADYIIQQLEQQVALQAWCVRLDVERCQELLRA